MGKGMRAGKRPNLGGSMSKQMQQVQAVHRKMEEIQARIDEMEETASSGGGAVTVTVNGKKELTKVEIKPEVVDPDDIEMLEDLIISAANEALRQMADTADAEMGKFTGGLGIPGL